MKKHLHNYVFIILLLPAVFFSVRGYTQDKPVKKYQSLLWKITGNGLQKPSYLYGTMHVSKKVAYRLDDVFYKALLSSDAVAVESTPDTWVKFINRNPEFRASLANRFLYTDEGFYREAFKIKSPEIFEINQLLGAQDSFLNAILYRTQNESRNLEEDTYLDMFIYQAGTKFGKKAFSLENVDESNYLVSRAQIQAYKNQASPWLQKKLKEKNYYDFLEDAYRKRDLDVIDSISLGTSTEHNLKYMLWIRNRNMMHTLDSLMQSGISVFAGIGAAHLPGEHGAIELLRSKGYTVEAYTSDKTQYAIDTRKTIENTFLKKDYPEFSPGDAFVSLKAPREFTELNLGNYDVFISPDLTNGAYLILTRIHLFNALNKKRKFDFQALRSMIYESTHGEIIEQKEVSIDGYPAIDVRSKTKEKDDQRYLYILTPLELIVVKMGGKKDFVKRYGDEVFQSIRLKTADNKPEQVHPEHREFEVELPAFHTFDNPSNYGRRIVEAFDRSGDNYYFLIEQILTDVDYLEEDDFELQQIQRRFYERYDIDLPEGQFTHTANPSYRSSAEFDPELHDTLFLMTRLRGNQYFLLGSIGKDRKKADAYFDSFRINTPQYHNPFKQVKDTSLYFSVKTTITPPDTYMNYYDNMEKNDKYKPYMGISRDNDYISSGDESINVSFHKFNDFSSYENLDSLWKATLDYYRKDLSFIVLDHKTDTDKNGYPYLEAHFGDTLSGRRVWLKKILAHDRKYSIRFVSDSIHEPGEFVRTFYDSFTPYDTVFGPGVLEDKLPRFLHALSENDSLVFDTYDHLSIRKPHLKTLRKFISRFSFPKNKQHIRNYFLTHMAQIAGTETGKFLDSLYIASYDNSYAQHAILLGYAMRHRKSYNRKILNLLESDLPLTDKKSPVQDLFAQLDEQPGKAKDMFPGLLEFITVSDYKEHIFELLNTLKDSGYVRKKNYKPFKNQILTEAKIELKRVMSKSYTEEKNTYYDNDVSNMRLTRYLNLLYPFRKDKKVKSFIRQIEALNDNKVKEKLLYLQISANENYSTRDMDSVCKDLKTRWLLYSDLKHAGKTSHFPKAYKNQKSIAESLLFSSGTTYDKKTDTIVFIGKRNIRVNHENYQAYIFKTKKIRNNYSETGNNWMLHAAAFAEKDMKPIAIDYLYSINREMTKAKTEEEEIKILMESIMWKDKKRVMLDEPSYY